MLTGYFDEAGDKQCGFTFVCGWISNVELWERFECDWKILLGSHNLPYFHMKEFSQSTGLFRKFKSNEGSRRKFLGQAADIIHSVAQRAFICGVHHDAFTKLHEEYPVSFNTPYALAGRTCIAWANAWSRLAGQSGDLEYVFDDGGPDKGGLIASLARHPELSSPIFRPSRDVLGKKGNVRVGVVQLQAADYLAYEIRKFIADHPKYKSGERMPRVSLSILRQTPADIKLFGYERLSKMCQLAGLVRKDKA